MERITVTDHLPRRVPVSGLGPFSLLAAVIVATLAFSTSPITAGAHHLCSDLDAVQQPGGSADIIKFTTPAEQLVTAICLKAGSLTSDRIEKNGNYDLDFEYVGSATADCYFEVAGIGTKTVSATRKEGAIGGCAGSIGLTNMEVFYCGYCPPPRTKTPEPTPTPETPTPTPETPTPTATPETPTPTATTETPTPTATDPPATATPTDEPEDTPTSTATSTSTPTATATPVEEVLAEVAVLPFQPPPTGSGGLLDGTSNIALGLGVLAINVVLMLTIARARARS